MSKLLKFEIAALYMPFYYQVGINFSHMVSARRTRQANYQWRMAWKSIGKTGWIFAPYWVYHFEFQILELSSPVVNSPEAVNNDIYRCDTLIHSTQLRNRPMGRPTDRHYLCTRRLLFGYSEKHPGRFLVTRKLVYNFDATQGRVKNS